jgi:tether containing UBX domain for GLUT4
MTSVPPSELQTSSESTVTQPEFKVFKPNTSAASKNSSRDIPDSFFTPTPADLKAAQAALSDRAQSLVNAPLQLRATREATEKAKRDRWPTTKIRVKFTDQTVLEKTFPSTDKIRSVYAFVRPLLREDVKPIKFILYQPPKRDLKVSDLKVRDLTLAELQLAPSSILLLRFENDELNGSDYPAPLNPDVLSQAIDLPPPPEIVQVSQQNNAPSTSSTPGAAAKGKVPKWLAAGLKRK